MRLRYWLRVGFMIFWDFLFSPQMLAFHWGGEGTGSCGWCRTVRSSVVRSSPLSLLPHCSWVRSIFLAWPSAALWQVPAAIVYWKHLWASSHWSHFKRAHQAALTYLTCGSKVSEGCATVTVSWTVSCVTLVRKVTSGVTLLFTIFLWTKSGTSDYL